MWNEEKRRKKGMRHLGIRPNNGTYTYIDGQVRKGHFDPRSGNFFESCHCDLSKSKGENQDSEQKSKKENQDLLIWTKQKQQNDYCIPQLDGFEDEEDLILGITQNQNQDLPIWTEQNSNKENQDPLIWTKQNQKTIPVLRLRGGGYDSDPDDPDEQDNSQMETEDDWSTSDPVSKKRTRTVSPKTDKKRPRKRSASRSDAITEEYSDMNSSDSTDSEITEIVRTKKSLPRTTQRKRVRSPDQDTCTNKRSKTQSENEPGTPEYPKTSLASVFNTSEIDGELEEQPNNQSMDSNADISDISDLIQQHIDNYEPEELTQSNTESSATGTPEEDDEV